MSRVQTMLLQVDVHWRILPTAETDAGLHDI